MDDRVLKELTQQIHVLKETALAVRSKGVNLRIPAVERNAARILASVKMLELTMGDLLDDRAEG